VKQFKQKIQEGFTLVEILIVVVIIGILATVAIPTYFSYVEKAYASDAKTQIKNILMNADIYRQTEGEYPTTIEDMENGYLDIKQSVKEKWVFEIDIAEDGLTGTISATSTDKMSGGADHQVVYDLETGEYKGYGQGDEDESE
jgi:prepilin-type N-terminal cleavage/methylation domain-containing protein